MNTAPLTTKRLPSPGAYLGSYFVCWGFIEARSPLVPVIRVLTSNLKIKGCVGTFCFALRLYYFLWHQALKVLLSSIYHIALSTSLSLLLSHHTHKHALTLNHPSVKHTHTHSLSKTNAICSKFLKIYSKPYFVVWRLFQKSIFSYFFEWH